MAKINVLVPVFNGEKYIRETLERVLEQDYDDFDVLVCDNASEDGTAEEISKVKDPRIRLYSNSTNLGMAGNWDRLLSEADGEYVIFVCADDLLLQGALKKKAAVLDEFEDIVLVSSATNVVNENGKKIYTRRPFRKNMRFIGSEFFEQLFTERNLLGEPTNNMLRLSAARRAGKFREELWYTVDWDFWLRMACEGDICYINEPLSGFRVSGASTTMKSSKEKIIGDERVFLQEYKAGGRFPVTEEMLRKREKNVRSRLNMRFAFLKAVSVFSKK